MSTLRYRLLTVLVATGCSAAATTQPPQHTPDMTGADAQPTAPADAGADATGGPVIAVDQGGTRLELRKWTTDDGTDAGHFFFDRTRQFACTFYAVDASKYRCFPTDNVIADPIRFADPQCTQSVYLYTRTACGQPPGYIRQESAIATCPTSYTLHKLGAKLPGRTYYSRSSNGSCFMIPVGDGDDLYAIGDPVPLDDLVAGTLRVGPAVADFAQRTVEGEDGSRSIFGFRDLAGQRDCSTRVAADGSFRCLPNVVGTMTAYSDNACTMPAGLGTKSSCAPAGAYLSRSTRFGCTTRTSILPAGQRLALGYEKFSSGCGTGTAAPFDDFWSGGPELAASNFVAATLTTADGTARLRPRIVGTPAGNLTTQSLWDTKLDQACGAYLMSDGTYRCVGSGRPAIATGFFADAQCTQAALADFPDAQGQACATGYYFKSDTTQCPPRVHVFSVDAQPFTGPLYQMGATGCAAMTTAPVGPVHLIGPEVAPTDFAELKPPAP